MKLALLTILHLYLVCGHPSIGQFGKNVRQQRIVGGQPANAGQFPWAAAITVTTPSGRYFCGGALLHTLWVLTAGQCVDGATLFTILVGTNQLDGSTAQRFATELHLLHPEYNSENLDNDIALIRFREPIHLNDYIKVANVPFFDAGIGMAGQAIGWGQTTDDDAGLVNDLHWVTLQIVEQQECRLVYGNQITDNMFCAAGNYNEGACVGDSGSPLSLLVTWDYYIILGVSSFVSAYGCESTHPSGYVRVNRYLDWLRNATDNQV